MAKQFATQTEREQHVPGAEQHTPVVRREATAPLVVGHAADTAERDADRVADEVIARLHGADAHVHAAGCGHDGQDVSRSFAGGAAPEVGLEGGELSDGLSGRIESARGSGRPLEEPVRRRMESAFGGSLAGVRIHTGGEAAELNRSISARAFTTGDDVFFGAGQYRPDTAEGERMLAHELAHTRQQAGAARRVHRKWDIRAKSLGLTRAVNLRTVRSRPVWFIEDTDGDEIVVKSENQPIGLGDVVGAMHKKVNKVGSVKQRQLDKSERRQVDNLISIYGDLLEDPSFAARGDYLKADDKSDWHNSTEDSGHIGATDALAQVRDTKRNLVAMTVAPGESAEARAEATQKGGSSGVRGILSDYEHVVQLGELTFVDLFMGNQDRVYTGNLGNWFYDYQDRMTLIDHVDQAAPSRMTANFRDNSQWADTVGDLLKNLPMTATNAIDYGFAAAAQQLQDKEFRTWLKEPGTNGGATIKVELEHFLVGGMKKSRRKMLQVFGASRWNVLSRTTRRRNAIKKAARSGASTDQADATTYDGNAPDYWTVLKERVDWIRKHTSD